jgi:DNA polymerase III delta prime subunit
MFHSNYSPNDLKSLDFNSQINNLNIFDDLPHIVIYGGDGTGKKTRIRLLIKRIFPDYKKSEKMVIWKTKGEVPVFISNYHYWIDCYTLRSYEKQIIRKYIKEIGSNKSIIHHKYRFIIFDNAQYLSEIGQSMLRQMIEKYSEKLRFIFITNSLSKFSSILQSRCLLVRNAAPNDNICKYILKMICDNEGIIISNHMLNKFLKKSIENYGYNNLWFLIHILELSYGRGKKIYFFKDTYDKTISELLKLLLNNEFNFIEIRALLFKIDLSNFDLVLVLHKMLIFFLKHVKDSMLKIKLINLFAKNELLLIKCNKKVVVLEKICLDIYRLIHNF